MRENVVPPRYLLHATNSIGAAAAIAQEISDAEAEAEAAMHCPGPMPHRELEAAA